MKKTLITALLGLGLALLGFISAAPAQAYTAQQDAQYVMLLTQAGMFNNLGPTAEAQLGERIANDIALCIRDPLAERNWIYSITNSSVGYTDANMMVNTATLVYLGFMPPAVMPGC